MRNRPLLSVCYVGKSEKLKLYGVDRGRHVISYCAVSLGLCFSWLMSFVRRFICRIWGVFRFLESRHSLFDTKVGESSSADTKHGCIYSIEFVDLVSGSFAHRYDQKTSRACHQLSKRMNINLAFLSTFRFLAGIFLARGAHLCSDKTLWTNTGHYRPVLSWRCLARRRTATRAHAQIRRRSRSTGRPVNESDP